MLVKPKICVSITAGTREEILEQAELYTDLQIEMAEWRADFYEEVDNTEKVLSLIHDLKEILANVELIFTLRTVREGGEEIPEGVSYRTLLSAVISQGEADFTDIETGGDTDVVEALFSLSKEKKMNTIASYHNFEKTPAQNEIVSKWIDMEKMGATIGKIAVMPNTEEEVDLLLGAASEMKLKKPEFQIIAISMGSIGKASRIYGGLYGSEVTFGCLGKSSAPGQIPVKELRKKIDTLYSGKRHIILIGFMGTGKTTISNELGKRNGQKVIDTDQLITMMEGRSIEDIFATEGEKYFRRLESKSIDRLGSLAPCIVSCGGGMVLKELNVRKLKAIGTVVLLTAEPATILSRVKDDDSRPILNGNMNEKFIKELMQKRRPYYEAAAEVIISTDGKEVDEIADEIKKQLKNNDLSYTL